jgi:membrane associated rhomboid family serine protease
MIPIRDDNPAERPPVVTRAIIVLCVLVFLWQLSLGPSGQQAAAYALGLVPAVLTGAAVLDPGLHLVPAPLTLVTSMFLHGDGLHLGGNLLYLWIFGNNVEDRLGHVRFALFYLLAGLAAAGLQILPAPASTVPMIGASGAISGVLGAYLVFFPRARVLVLIPLGLVPLLYLPAAWLLGFWLVMQLANAFMTSGGEGGVAWWAHVGGFLAGMFMALPLRRPPAARAPTRRGPWG